MAKGLRIPKEFDFGGQWDLITELKQDWGNRVLEGTNKTFCAPGARRKEQCPQKRLSQTCLWVCKSLWWGVGWQWPAAGSKALNTAMHTQAILKEIIITFITPTIVWPQAKNREGTQPHPLTENWINDLLSILMPSPIRIRPHSCTICLTHQEASISPLTLSIRRGDRLETTITKN